VARLPVSNIWNDHLLRIIAFPPIIAPFLCEKNNNHPRLSDSRKYSNLNGRERSLRGRSAGSFPERAFLVLKFNWAYNHDNSNAKIDLREVCELTRLSKPYKPQLLQTLDFRKTVGQNCYFVTTTGHPTTIFGRISVRKTIWDLEFSKHLL